MNIFYLSYNSASLNTLLQTIKITGHTQIFKNNVCLVNCEISTDNLKYNL